MKGSRGFVIASVCYAYVSRCLVSRPVCALKMSGRELVPWAGVPFGKTGCLSGSFVRVTSRSADRLVSWCIHICCSICRFVRILNAAPVLDVHRWPMRNEQYSTPVGNVWKSPATTCDIEIMRYSSDRVTVRFLAFKQSSLCRERRWYLFSIDLLRSL